MLREDVVDLVADGDAGVVAHDSFCVGDVVHGGQVDAVGQPG